MGATTWLAHTLYEYGRTLRMRGGSDDAARRRRCSQRPAALAERIGMPVLLARSPALGARSTGARTPPDDLSWREVEILRLVAAGRSNREIGDGALHQRAHGRQPRAQHPAQDRRREPHRGGRLRATAMPLSTRPTGGRIAAHAACT